jgi:hypothetical protein
MADYLDELMDSAQRATRQPHITAARLHLKRAADILEQHTHCAVLRQSVQFALQHASSTLASGNIAGRTLA